MPLATTVKDCSNIGTVSRSNPPQRMLVAAGMEFPVSCHVATVYWAITDLANGKSPQVSSPRLTSAGPILKVAVSQGKKLVKSKVTAVVPGTIVVFTSNGAANHSCTATDGGYIAGYNQNGWFQGGLTNQYSLHHLGDLAWDGDQVQTVHHGSQDIYTLREESFKSLVLGWKG